MTYKFVNPSLVQHFNRIQAITEKFEADLIASGRFKHIRTEGNKKIYIERATGREVPVKIPMLPQKQIAS
jgi:hypothetical protein